MRRSMPHRIWVGLVPTLLLAACGHDLFEGTQRTIEVDDVEELYAAVADADHEGFVIQLAQGRYVLTARAPDQSERPHGGMLRLRTGMKLVGAERRRDGDGDGIPDHLGAGPNPVFAEAGTETVIDGYQISPPVLPVPDCSGTGPSFADPVVQLAPNTALRGLTILGGPNLAVGEGAEQYRPGTSLETVVESTVIQGGPLVMTFGNTGCSARSQQSTLTVTGSVFYGASGVALSVVNYQTGGGAGGAPKVTATIRESLFFGNGTGLAIRGGSSGTRNGVATVYVDDTRFDDNGSHLLVMGGFGNSTTIATAGNQANVVVTDAYFGRYTGSRGIQIYGGATPTGIAGTDRKHGQCEPALAAAREGTRRHGGDLGHRSRRR